MNDKLDDIFLMQQMLQVKLKVYDKIKSVKDRQEYINQMLLAIFEETVEVMRCTAYKNPNYSKFGWKLHQKFQMKKMQEEIIDLLHFVINLAMISGFDAATLHHAYIKKHIINKKRSKKGY